MIAKVKKRSLEIFAFAETGSVPGVVKKLHAQQKAFKANGYDTKLTLVGFSAIITHIGFIVSILKSDRRILYIRIAPNILGNLFLLFVITFKRLSGHYIICEIPSPLRTAAAEIFQCDFSLFKKIYYVTIMYIAFPCSLLTCHKVLSYGIESTYFSLGIRQKIQIVGNGIDVTKVQVRQKFPAVKDNETLKLVGVATLAKWHGYDRIIRGIAIEKRIYGTTKFLFDIIGTGPELMKLKKLTHDLGISGEVRFLGYVASDKLRCQLEDYHIAIGTLAGFRVGLKVSSDLKSREFCAAGIPFVSAQVDNDFQNSFPFIYKLPADESIPNLRELYTWFKEIKFNHKSISEMQRYAIDHLDYSQKVKDFLPDD